MHVSFHHQDTGKFPVLVEDLELQEGDLDLGLAGLGELASLYITAGGHLPVVRQGGCRGDPVAAPGLVGGSPVVGVP